MGSAVVQTPPALVSRHRIRAGDRAVDAGDPRESRADSRDVRLATHRRALPERLERAADDLLARACGPAALRDPGRRSGACRRHAGDVYLYLRSLALRGDPSLYRHNAAVLAVNVALIGIFEFLPVILFSIGGWRTPDFPAGAMLLLSIV